MGELGRGPLALAPAAADAVKDDPLARAAGARVGTLIAARDAKDPKVWHWDVRLQGKDETAFIEF